MPLSELKRNAFFRLMQEDNMDNKDLKFLIDVGVGKKVENWLSAQGYDIKSIRELDPRMPDEKILELASKEKRMVLTMDKDFGELVYSANLPHTGVLILRIEDFDSEQKVDVVRNILQEHQARIVGRFCVFKDNKLRIRQ